MNTKIINASIIALAYPDVFVKLTDEMISKITPYIGMGNKQGIKVGHAALCLINHETGDIDYYDFGRYVTPEGKGRTRNIITDEELHIPLKAIIENGVIKNLEEILIWLDNHPEKTHGAGTLFASVCSEINLLDAQNFITEIHTCGSIPYGVFIKQGSNCARFVFDTIMNSCKNKKIINKLAFEKIITPSPLGVMSRSSSSGIVYKIVKGNITTRKGFSRFEVWKYFFEKPNTSLKKEISLCTIKNSHLLTGVGSSAYFTLEATDIKSEYFITRYNEVGDIDCQNIFVPKETGFNIQQKYTFIYDSNCDHCHIMQNDTVYKFKKK